MKKSQGLSKMTFSVLSRTIVVTLMALTSFAVAAPFASANVANPSTINGTETLNADGSVTVNLSGTWYWAQQNCATRYGTGWAVDWWGVSSSSTPTNNVVLKNVPVVKHTNPGSAVSTAPTYSFAGSLKTHSGKYFHVGAYYNGEVVNAVSGCTDVGSNSQGNWSTSATYPTISDLPAGGNFCVNMYDEHAGQSSDFNTLTNRDNSIQDNNYDPLTSNGECVQINPPSMDTTTATVMKTGLSPVTLDQNGNIYNGSSVTDTATVTNSASSAIAIGTVTFSLYQGSCPSSNTSSPTGTLISTSAAESLNSGTATSSSFGQLGSGSYFFVASYSGVARTYNASYDSLECFTVINPSIAITKTPASQDVTPGGTATWTITVTNTGDTALTGVTVTDALAPNCNNSWTGSLAPSASEPAYQCSLDNVTTNFTNVATATGKDPNNNDVTANSSGAVVTVIHPSIAITKTPPTQAIVQGGTATWTITVTNTGDTALTGVTVTDALAPNCNNSWTGSLAPSASEPAYQCSLDNVTTGLVNTAVANGTDPNSNPVTAESSGAVVTVDVPAIFISKTPATQSVTPGGTATWTITVTNTGQTDLTNVNVTDVLAPNCDNSWTGTLAAGASELSYQCSLTNVSEGFTNVAVAHGIDPIENPVTDESAGAVVTIIHPAISITKTPPTQSVDSGGTASWTITVTNSGDVALTNVKVTDPLASNCNNSWTGSLAAGASETAYTCTLSNVTAGLTNVANAIGNDPNSNPVTAQSSGAVVTVSHPAIAITKTPPTQSVTSGGTATWTITVTNPGDVALTNVSVSDVQAPNCDHSWAGSLAPSASETAYTCTLTNVTAGLTNVAVANGTDANSNPVTAQSSGAVVTVIHPAIAITKTPPSQSVNKGGTATWTIGVTNTGDVALTNVAVTDALAPNCDHSWTGSLAPGASEPAYTCTLTNVTAGLTNVADAAALDPNSNPVTATSAGAVVALNSNTGGTTNPAGGSRSAIHITKTPPTQSVTSGGTATWTITVSNTGKVRLTHVNVTDPLAPNCDHSWTGSLAPGASEPAYTCSLTNVMAGFTNVATARGRNTFGSLVTSKSAGAVVTVTPKIPSKPAQTGFGGSARAANSTAALLASGFAAFLGLIGMVVVRRRRRA